MRKSVETRRSHMPVLRVEMPAELEFLQYRQMFLIIERNFYVFVLNKKFKTIRVGPVFQARAGTIANFFMWPKGEESVVK